MGEAHVHGFVNRMRRDVVVLDVRSPLLDIHHYQPGYSAQRQISKRTAHNLRFCALTEPIWLLLEKGHWSALLPTASRADELRQLLALEANIGYKEVMVEMELGDE